MWLLGEVRPKILCDTGFIYQKHFDSLYLWSLPNMLYFWLLVVIVLDVLASHKIEECHGFDRVLLGELQCLGRSRSWMLWKQSLC